MALKLKDIIAGNTRRIDLTFTDSTGTGYDITDADIAFTAVPSDSSTAVIEINNTDQAAQFTVLDADEGQIRVTLLPANTNQTAGSYNFGAQATLADGTVVEDTGSFKVKPQYVT